MDELVNLKLRELSLVPSHIEHNRNALLILYKTNCIYVNSKNHVSISESVSEDINIPYDVIKRYPNWYYINQKYYYYKRRDSIIRILNELINEIISLYMGLPTVHPILATDNLGISGTISKNFREKNNNYVYAYELESSEQRNIEKKILSNRTNKSLFKVELVRYIMRNIYTSLGDRTANLLFLRNGKNYRLAELFDYEQSFINWKNEIYRDSIFNNKMISLVKVGNLVSKNKIFNEAYEMIKYLSIDEMLYEVEKKHGISIPDEIKNYYQEYDELRHKVLKYTIEEKKTIF